MSVKRISESKWSKERSRVETQILELVSKKIDNGTFNDGALILDDKIGLNDFKKAVKSCVNLQASCASKVHVSMYCGDKISEYTDGELSHPWTLLTYAIYYCKYDKAKILLAAGADIHFRRNKYDNPAYYYMRGYFDSDIRIIDLCLSYGADINYSNNDGYSILHSCCSSNSSFEFFKALVNRGANIYKRTTGWKTPIIPIQACVGYDIKKFEYLLTLLPDTVKPILSYYINNMKNMSKDEKIQYLSKL